MPRAHDFAVDTPGRTPAKLASSYTPGLADRLGDRSVMFDNPAAASLELLRFRPNFASAPGFEQALRSRVLELTSFRHDTFADVHAVKWLEDGGGLTLVSTHTPGRRLSEMFDGQARPGL